jgi:ABC-2 type transport system permease protein
MKLFAAEWRRFFARRFTRIMLVFVVAVMAAIAIGTAVNSHRINAATRARAHQEYVQVVAQQQQDHDNCVAAQNGGPDPDGRYRLPPGATCDDFFPPDTGLTEDDFLNPPWNFADSARDVVLLYAGLLTLFAFAVGASYVGAEWASGGMMNLLLWRPRRAPVLATKLVTLLASVVVAGVVLYAVWMGMWAGVAATRGVWGHATAGTIRSIGLLSVRAMVIGLVAAAIGFGIASIGRGTATALGVAIGYVLLFEGAGHVIFGRLLDEKRPQRFFLSSYVDAFLTKKATFGADTCEAGLNGLIQCRSTHWTIGSGAASAVLGILLAAVLVWAFIAFWRRDVT